MLEFCYSVNFYLMVYAFWALSQWLDFRLSLFEPIVTPFSWFYDGQMTMRVFYLLASGPVAASCWAYSRALSFHDFKETVSF